ncbi:MAG: hypothetical protein RLW62_02925 [Gammaproteobacteria bacterium]
MTAAVALALGTTTAVLLWLLLSRLAGLLAAPLVTLLAPLPALARARCLLLVALYPLLLAPLLAMAVFHAPASHLFVRAHCHVASGCVPHAPLLALPEAAAGWLGAGAVAVIAVLLCTAFGVVRRRAALATTLVRLARAGAVPGWRVLASAQPEVRCVGLLRPAVLVSSGLLERCGAAALEVHLLHAHARALRHDDLRALLARLAMAAWPPAGRRRVLAALAQAAAESCDALVVRALGDAAPVIRMLDAAQHWAPGTAAVHATLAGRRAALAAALPARRRLQPRLVLVAALGALPCIALPGLLHRLAEHVLPLV